MPMSHARIRSARPAARPAALLAVAATAALVQPASATWSILIADTRTREIAVGSATCVPGINLRAETPVLLLGRGAATAQSVVDISGINRARIFSEMARGHDPQSILDLLAVTDAGHDNRQYGLIDAFGSAVTYSGPNNAAWAGGVTGRIEAGAPGPADDIIYCVQGNILTGEPVVAAAEDAILTTEGDLAEKLMAAMEAAYAFGGDGRCSCAGPDPTGCGSPPVDGFDKSADVGYMLVGRLGDREGNASFMPTSGFVGLAIGTDADSDGRGDLVTFPSFAGEIELLRNTTPNPAGPLTFDSASISTNLSGVIAADTHDIDSDGDDDLIVVNASTGYVFKADGDGGFAAAVESALGTGIAGGVVGAFDSTNGPSPEILIIRSSGTEARVFRIDADGSITPGGTVALPAAGVGIARMPGGVAVALADNSVLPLASNGDGTFTPGTPAAVSGRPVTIDAADFNGDGVTDYAVGRNDRRFSLLLSGGGAYTETETVFGAPIRDSGVTDFDGDGDPDALVLLTSGRLIRLQNDGVGSLTELPIVRTLSGSVLNLADVTADGLEDVVTASGSIIGVYRNEGAGPLPADRGFAGGDYFLELNVPNAPEPPFLDPVPQLREMFDQWRTALDGQPDGSRSYITQSPGRINATGADSGPYQIVAHFVDFEGDPVEQLDPERFELIAPPGRPVPLRIESAIPAAAPGAWVFSAVPTGETGPTELWLRYNAETGPAVIQPAPSLSAGLSLADIDADGILDLSDIVAFVTAFLAGDATVADLTGDGVVGMADIDLFLSEFDAG